MTDLTSPLIDIGVNLTSGRFRNDLSEVLVRSQSAGIEHMLVTGTSAPASREALELAQQHPKLLSATAGVHPHHAKDWHADSAAELSGLLADPQVVAVGECGLDFNRNFSPQEDQLTCFEAQLQLAAEIGKPVFLHQRDAHHAFLPLLKQYRDSLAGAVVHCFTGSREEAEDYLDLDCHIGITGWLCDKKRGGELRDLVKELPVERLMIETDAPYLTPHNLDVKPKGNRNEPAFLHAVLRQLAECRGSQVETLARQMTENTRTFFGLQHNSA